MNQQRKPSTATRATQFGPEYEQLLLTVWAKTPFRFPFESIAGARAMRAKLYAYFRHLRAENLRLDLIEMADSLQITMDQSVLIILKNEQTWDHEAIRKILGVTSDAYGLKPAAGQELKQPDLMHGRLLKQLQKVRARQTGESQQVTEPAANNLVKKD